MAAGDLTTLANVKSYLGILGKPISAITKANPGQVTCTAHGLTTGLQVGLSGINGMTELNGTTPTVTVIDANNFTIGVNTSAYGTYTSSGYVSVDDPLLNRLITSVSDWIKSYCNYPGSIISCGIQVIQWWFYWSRYFFRDQWLPYYFHYSLRKKFLFIKFL